MFTVIDPLPCVGGLVTSHDMWANSGTGARIVASVRLGKRDTEVNGELEVSSSCTY